MKYLLHGLAAIVLVAGGASAQAPRPGDADLVGPLGGRDASPGAGELHAALHLRPEQEGAWRSFSAATAPDPDPARAAQIRGAVAQLAAMTTPERLDFTQAQLRRDAEAFAARATAVRAFYAQLTPDQKQVFDRITGPRPSR